MVYRGNSVFRFFFSHLAEGWEQKFHTGFDLLEAASLEKPEINQGVYLSNSNCWREL